MDWNGCQTNLSAFVIQSANRQVAQAGSLFLLEILTVVPNAVVTNQLAQFIPFSVGALLVLGTLASAPPRPYDTHIPCQAPSIMVLKTA